uniref:Uncharacterized protein n=1 Tax=Panagrolaimus sp. PS1159 TaxID=55785 RepID=A0AC35GGL5_9BILA
MIMKRKHPDNSTEDIGSRRRQDPYLQQFQASGLTYADVPHESLRKKMDGFSKKYLMRPSLWDLRTRYEPNMTYERYVELTKRALSDFYSQEFVYDGPSYPEYNERFRTQHKPFDRLMEWQNRTEMRDCYNNCIGQAGTKDLEPMLKEVLSFPHSCLTQFRWCYEEFSGTPLTPQLSQQYLFNKKLYNQIKTLELEENNTVAGWFKAIIQTNELQFIVQNVEARIAREIGEQIDREKLNPELWQLYIKYLLTKNQLLAEEVYYRFRRLFINDRSLASNFPSFRGKVSAKAKAAMEKMKYNTLYVFKALPSAPVTIFNSPSAKQELPFRNSFMHYILTNASQNVLKKLYFSCKYFYFAKRKLLCHSLYVRKDLKLQYFRNSMSSSGEEPEFAEMDKLIVQNTMIVQHSEKRNLFHSIFPKLEACSFRFLRITSQTFSVNEYDFLTSGGKIMKLVFQDVLIFDENGEPIVLEHFLYNLPRAMYIVAPLKTRTTHETETMLFNWNKPQKLYTFSILLDDTLMEMLEPMKLFKFLERLVANVKKSTAIVYFEKGNENIANYLHRLRDAKQIYRQQYGRAAPKVGYPKMYAHLL